MAKGKGKARRESRRNNKAEKKKARQERRDKVKDDKARRKNERIEQRQAVRQARIASRTEKTRLKAEAKKTKWEAKASGNIPSFGEEVGEALGGVGKVVGGIFGGGSEERPLEGVFDTAMNTLGIDKGNPLQQRDSSGTDLPDVVVRDYNTGYYDKSGEWVVFNALQKALLKIGLIKKQH